MPPDASNTERALRSNSNDSNMELCEGLDECAENDAEERGYYWKYRHPQLCDVILQGPVLNKQFMIKLRKTFYYEGNIKSLIDGCKNPPFLLKKMLYLIMYQILKKMTRK